MSYLHQLFNLSGKVALVTGGTGGLGLGLAQALRCAGAQVAVMGRREEALKAAIEQLGEETLALQADVSEPEAVHRAVEQLVALAGRVDILVNAAGTHVIRPSLELSLEEWEQVIRVNLTGSFICAQAVAPWMRQQGWGRIINIGSVMSDRGLPRRAAYASSKGGLVLLTRTLAQEWGPWGIRVNAIAPGFFHTAMTDRLFQDPAWVERLQQRLAVGRAGRPEDLAGALVYLASPAADYTTGQVLYVDGGFTTGEPW